MSFQWLLQDAPEDRDGLVLLGLVLYNRGNLARATMEVDISVDDTSTADKASECEQLPAREYRKPEPQTNQTRNSLVEVSSMEPPSMLFNKRVSSNFGGDVK